MATYRDQLIRAVFELERDLTWCKNLEPGLREQSVDAATMASLRAAWNQAEEKRNWVQWQSEATRFSNAVLDDMRMDRIDQLDMLGMLRWQRDRAASERFQQILRGTMDRQEKPQEQARDKGREL